MKMSKIRLLLEEAKQKQQIMNTYLCYSHYYYNLIPIELSNKLLLAINEDDFILNGFRIVRVKDIKKIKIKDDICTDILRAEGVLDNISIPVINLDNWEMVFISLKNYKKNIIIENENLDDTEMFIGRIEAIRKKHVIISEFDAEGKWNKETTKIAYSSITVVKFGTRYVEVFSKYLKG